MDERPSHLIVNCDPSTFIFAPDGETPLNAETVEPWTDEELADHEQHIVELEAEAVANRSPLEKLADHLETLPAGQPVVASDLLAILRPEEQTADA